LREKRRRKWRQRLEADKAMASITVYGGAGEIGGNKVLVEDQGARIWLDFGMSFRQADRYLAEFLQPKKFHGVLDFLELGLLPRLPDLEGLYRDDYLEHSGLQPTGGASYEGVFLTHAHADHSAYIHFLRRDIPVYSSDVTKRVLTAMEDTGSSAFADYTRFTRSFQLRPSKQKGQEHKLVRAKGEEVREARNFTVLEEHDSAIRVRDSLRLEGIPVNHSIPGACAYIVETSAGPVIYTGDLRFHGYAGNKTEDFVRKAVTVQPLALICEGTRIGDAECKSEQDLQNEIAHVASSTENLVVANYPPRDIERMRTFYEAAKKCDRKLCVSLKQAYLLRLLEGTDAEAPSLNDPNIAIHVDRKEWGLITKPGYPDEIVRQDYDSWEREFLGHPNAVTCDDISQAQSRFVVRVDFFELTDLVDLKPKPGSTYIRSITEPFNEEHQIELRRVENWLQLFGLYPYHQIHASGHASGPELIEMIKQIRPKMLIPVHTEHPEVFEQELAGTGIAVHVPRVGEPIPIP
jgi:ribonuclease J